MKKFVSLLITAALTVSALSACAVKQANPLLEGDVRTYILSNAEHAMREQDLPYTQQKTLEASLAKNEYEAVQFIFQSDSEIKNLSVSFSDLKNDRGDSFGAENIELYRQHYLKTTFSSADELPVGWYPDALIPMYEDLNSCTVEAKNNQGYWLSFHATQSTPAGIYEGEVIATYDGGKITLPLYVEVWDFEIPVTPSFMSCFQLWPNDLVGYYYNKGVEIDYGQLQEQYYKYLSNYRISCSNLPVAGDTVDEYLQNAASYFEDERISSINVPYYYSGFAEDGTLIHDERNNELIQKLTEKGWIDKAYYYLGSFIDEPSNKPEAVARVKMFCDDVRSYTSIPHIVTCHIREDLFGIVDGWCPQPDGAKEDVIRERLAQGDDVWWYTSCTPVYPYVNYHTDNYLIAPRILRWMQEDYGISGDLLWATTIYTKWNGTKYEPRDVWNDPNTSTEGVHQAVGDGLLVYPGTENDGIINRNIPVPTLRLEAIRDGAEDLEYLKLVEQKYQKVIDKYSLPITLDEAMDTFYTPLYTAANDFAKDTSLLLQTRKTLAAIIMSDDESLIMSSMEKSLDGSSLRSISVYAESGADVKIDGETVSGIQSGNGSVYCKGFAVESPTTVEISVNQINYSLLLSPITESEYIYAENAYIKEDAKNSFTPDIIVDEKTDGFNISVYTGENMTVFVNGNEIEKVAQSDGTAKFFVTHGFTGGKAALCEITVSDGVKTETFRRFLVKRAVARLDLMDLESEAAIAAISSIAANKYGTYSSVKEHLGTPALSVEIGNGAISRFTLKDAFTEESISLKNYTHLSLVITNPTSETLGGLSINVLSGSSSIEVGSFTALGAGKTILLNCVLPTDSYGDPLLDVLGSIRIISKTSSQSGKYLLESFSLKCLKSS